MDYSYLSCPDCRSKLTLTPPSVVCSKCQSSFPIVHDVPVFSVNREYRFSPTPRDWLPNAIARHLSERRDDPRQFEALLQAIVDKVPECRRDEWIENLVDESRAAAKYLLSLRANSHVLNLGCGWDNTTISLARTCRRVTAIDLTLERIHLLKLKKAYYDLSNIDLLCGGDRRFLPFADNTFDTVFLNGVLEWVATSGFADKVKSFTSGRVGKFFGYLKTVYSEHRPADIQLQFLKEVCRVLKPKGQLFVGIENRYSREYFRGRRDHHSYLRFTSLYPRFLAHIVSLCLSHKPY